MCGGSKRRGLNKVGTENRPAHCHPRHENKATRLRDRSKGSRSRIHNKYFNHILDPLASGSKISRCVTGTEGLFLDFFEMIDEGVNTPLPRSETPPYCPVRWGWGHSLNIDNMPFAHCHVSATSK